MPFTISLDQELARHNTQEDAWCAINGRVYDITPYFEFHPGGEKQLLRGAGEFPVRHNLHMLAVL